MSDYGTIPGPATADAASLGARLLVAVLSLLAVTVTCAVLGAHAGEISARLSPATCVAFGCYCEADATRGPREVVDAWSSLAPAVAGALLLVHAMGRRPAHGTALARSRAPTALLSVAASSIAIFSFLYHATHSLLGEWLDAVSLYLLAGFGIAWVVARARRLSPGAFVVVYLSIAAFPAALAWAFPVTRKVSFLALVILAIAAEVVGRRSAKTRADGRWLALAIGCFAVALAAWSLDWTRRVCAPGSILQLHAVWHLLSAPTILALHAYYASERVVPSAMKPNERPLARPRGDRRALRM